MFVFAFFVLVSPYLVLFCFSHMKGLGCIKGKFNIYVNTSLGTTGTVLFHYNYVESSEPIRDHGLGVILLLHTLLNLTEDSFLTNE